MRGIKAPLWRRLLCRIGLHGRVLVGGGALCGDDLWTCVECGEMKYPEVFSGIGLQYRDLTDAARAVLSIRPQVYARRIAAWRNAK